MSFDNKELELFINQFKFDYQRTGYVGIEREHFLMSPSDKPVALASEFLARINDTRWTYELSACQVEVRTKPHQQQNGLFSDLRQELKENYDNGKRVAQMMNVKLANCEVWSRTMPLDIYPDPRYIAIAKNIPRNILMAACQVAGTHIHVGMRDIDEAIVAHNKLIKHLDSLCVRGDHSKGRRLKLYKVMANNWQPVEYRDKEHFFEVAKEQGFAENPRNCWHLIRISKHGTVELRMFGATDDIDEIIDWVEIVKALI